MPCKSPPERAEYDSPAKTLLWRFTLTGTTGSVQIVLRGSRELTAGGVKRALLFPRVAKMNQRSAIIIDHIEENVFYLCG